MRGVKAKATKRVLPWWLAEENESCAACNHGYAHRTEIFCLDCDAPVCPICIERTETLELVCPGCLESRATEEVS